MDRFSEQLELPDAGEAPFSRADLIFYGVDHSKDSFEARIFFNNPEADETTPLEAEHGYAGFFVIFGHGGCAGDEGHCDIPEDPDDTDDLRLPHPLHPATKPVIVTDALKAVEEGSLTVTVVPVMPGTDAPRRDDVLFFKSLELVTYA